MLLMINGFYNDLRKIVLECVERLVFVIFSPWKVKKNTDPFGIMEKFL